MPDSFQRPDAALLALRPTVATEAPTDTATESTPGDFLHTTLRPALKLQNPLLLATVADFVRDYHVPLTTADPTDQRRLVAELLTRNARLRATVMGLVVGTFTVAELDFYRRHRPELNRRLLELAIRRVQEQVATVAALSLAT